MGQTVVFVNVMGDEFVCVSKYVCAVRTIESMFACVRVCERVCVLRVSEQCDSTVETGVNGARDFNHRIVCQ